MRARFLVVRGVELVEGSCALPYEESHHVRDVLRLRPGAPLTLSDGRGRLADAKISSSKREVIVEIHAVRKAPLPRTSITMFQAIGKSDKVDRVVRGAAELGIARFVPVSTARSVAEREQRRDRWASIAEDSARVSGRAFLMEIDPITTLEAVAARSRAAVSICFSGDASTRLSALDLRVDSVELLVGPEGGLEPHELELLVENGFVPVGLGPHTLRTETAGLATAAIVTFLVGGFDDGL